MECTLVNNEEDTQMEELREAHNSEHTSSHSSVDMYESTPWSQRRILPICPKCRTKASRRESSDHFYCKTCTATFSKALALRKSRRKHLVEGVTQDENSVNNSTATTKRKYIRRNFKLERMRKEEAERMKKEDEEGSEANSFNSQNHPLMPRDPSQPPTWSSRRKNPRVSRTSTDRDIPSSPRQSKLEMEQSSDTEEEDPFDAPSSHPYLETLHGNNWMKIHDDNLQACQ